MAYSFFVNMQKRSDGKIYADLHKTDEKIYFFMDDCLSSIEAHPEIKEHRHVVELVALTTEDWKSLVKDPTVQEAELIGTKGSEGSEQEQLLFEAWMKGKGWKVGGDWNGKDYEDLDENDKDEEVDLEVTQTRKLEALMTKMLWTAWRDRSNL